MKRIFLPLLFVFSQMAFAQTLPTSQPTDFGGEKCRLVNEKDEIVAVLANGMTVIVKRVDSPVVHVRGVVSTGSVYEGKWLGAGLSHLLEHLVAGGSNQHHSEAEDRDLLQQIGNNSNAYTTEDRTAFFVNTTPPHMEQAVDLVTSWLLGAKITEPEYKREHQVVQRELEMDAAEPDRAFYDLTTVNRYRVNPARVPVIGFQEVIRGLSRDDVYNYYKLAYEPGNMTFAVVGNLPPEQMLAAIRKNVADAPPRRVFSHDITPEPPVLSPRSLIASFPKLGQARLQLAFPSVKLDSPDLYALDLLATILGGGDSSILVQELRDKQQLVSSVAVGDDTPSYVDGTFAIDMQLDPDKVQPATEAALKLLSSVVSQTVPADRIARAKTQMKVARVKSLQTVDQIATSLADDFINTGDIHFTDRYLEKIDALTADEIQSAAKRYLNRNQLLITLMLPRETSGPHVAKAENVLRPPPTSKPAGGGESETIHRFVLDNGTILLLKRVTTSPLVEIHMYGLGGVTAEDDKTNGLGNLAMQMVPRGSTHRTAQQIAEFFDSVGGDFQCVSGNNSWEWSGSCLKDDLEKTLDVFCDAVEHPAFDQNELAEMKTRIAAAIDSEDADWGDQTMRFFKQEYFGPKKSPYRFLPIGTKENLQTFTQAQLRDWYEKTIRPSSRVIAVFGNINIDHVHDLLSHELSEIPPASTAAAPASFQPPSQATGSPSVDVLDVEVKKTEQDQAGIAIGYTADGVIGDPLNDVLSVDQTMAGGWGYPTGYLFETLRGMGLVYDVENQNVPGRNARLPGTYFVFAGCEPANVNRVVDQILLNIARLQGSTADMQQDWFNRAKQLIITSDAIDSETLARQAQTAALDELFGLGYDYHRSFAQRIGAVTMDQVRQAADARLRKCMVTICTPAPEIVSIKPGPRKYDSFPPVDLTPRGPQHDANGAP